MKRGLTLLEVILAIAILGGALAVVGELVRLASRNATYAREMTTAQLLCEAKLEELASGAVLPEASGPTVCETDPEWLYTVAVDRPDQSGLLQVKVTCEQAIENPNKLSFSLVRWMIDPEFLAQLDAAAASSSSSSTTTGSTTPASGS